jgi:hypothetical protein
MDPQILTAISGALGSIATGAFTYLVSKLNSDSNEMRRDIKKLTSQIAAYYALENAYMERLSELDANNKTPRTIQIEMRNSIAGLEKYERPEMTENQARKINDRWN